MLQTTLCIFSGEWVVRHMPGRQSNYKATAESRQVFTIAGMGGEMQVEVVRTHLVLGARIHRLCALGFSSSTISITWMWFPLESDVQNNHGNLRISLHTYTANLAKLLFFSPHFPFMFTSVIHKLHYVITFLN